MTTLSNSGVQ